MQQCIFNIIYSVFKKINIDNSYDVYVKSMGLQISSHKDTCLNLYYCIGILINQQFSMCGNGRDWIERKCSSGNEKWLQTSVLQIVLSEYLTDNSVVCESIHKVGNILNFTFKRDLICWGSFLRLPNFK